MAEDKKGILVYADWIDKFEELEDDEAGRLIKHFFRYVNDLNPIAPDRTTKLMFIDLQNQLKRDLKKWENTVTDRSINGRLGNLKRWNLDLYNKVVVEEMTIEEAENIAKHRKVSPPDKTVSPPIANIAVNENVSVNVNDNVNVTVNEMKEEKEDFAFADDLQIKTKQKELILLLIKVWGFEGKDFPQGRSMIKSFVESQLKSIDDISHFAEQYKNYDEYKKLSGEQRHNSTGYFGTQAMQFQNSAWNIENWELKLNNFKSNNKKTTKFDKLADAYNTSNPYATNE